MPLSRELKKFFGSLVADPRQLEKMARMQREIDFLYAYLDLKKGERQYARTLAEVRADHLGRYEFAARQIRPEHEVIDAACGVGYGSWLLAEKGGATVTGVDISAQALQVARGFWAHSRVRFVEADCTNTGLQPASFDVAVSFETIEHVPVAAGLVAHLFELLKPGGRLICSTPNERVIPYDPAKYPHHVRHYTLEDIVGLLTSTGFVVESVCSQTGAETKAVLPGTEGKYLVLVARKPDTGG